MVEFSQIQAFFLCQHIDIVQVAARNLVYFESCLINLPCFCRWGGGGGWGAGGGGGLKRKESVLNNNN